MLFHLSIEADEPFRVASVLAEIWGGVAMPFPPVAEGSWVAFTGSDDGSIIEVYPRGTELREGDEGGVGIASEPRRHSATHFAMSTNLSEERVLSIMRREGWKAERCNRAGKFDLIEVWIEGCQMVEILTPAMQRQYLDAVTIGNWQQMLNSASPLKKAA